VSVSIYEGKKLVTNEDLVISEKNDLVNKEWCTKNSTCLVPKMGAIYGIILS
jgi:hypothetical protein